MGDRRVLQELEDLTLSDKPLHNVDKSLLKVRLKNDQPVFMKLKEFTLFSLLPPEIQDEIWNQAASGIRLLMIRASNPKWKSKMVYEDPFGFFSIYEELSLLSACKASRRVALREYPHRLPYFGNTLEVQFYNKLIEIRKFSTLVARPRKIVVQSRTPPNSASDISTSETLAGGERSWNLPYPKKQRIFNAFTSLFLRDKTILMVCENKRVPKLGSVDILFMSGSPGDLYDEEVFCLNVEKLFFKRLYAEVKEMHKGHALGDAQGVAN